MRIVITTWGSLGDLHPYLAIGVELRRRGHQVTIATLGAWHDTIRRAGLECHPIRPDVSPGDPESRELVRRVLDPRGGAQYLFQQVFAPHTRETYEDTLAAVQADGGADLLITHLLPLTGPVVAEVTGVRWVSCVLQPMSLLSAYDPPTPPQVPWLRELAALHPALGRLFNAIGRKVARPWVEPLYRLRAELGLPRGGNPVFEGQHSPRLVLGLFSETFAGTQPDFPHQMALAGFPFHDGANQRPLSPELRRFLDDGDPPIVFTLGSSAVWLADDFYATSIEAARALGRRAVLLAGEEAAALRDRSLPDTIVAVDYAPHSLVMPRAVANVHQGGIGTTAQALRAGRPMLVVPFGQDQPDNARRSVALGVARTIPRHAYRVRHVVAELSRLLADAACAEKASRVGARIRSEEGTTHACDAIESL